MERGARRSLLRERADVPRSYCAEILFDGRTYRSKTRETRELAASAVARLLGNPHWQERLSRPDVTSCSVRVVDGNRLEVEGGTAEDRSELLRIYIDQEV
jgi:hypothetical protein